MAALFEMKDFTGNRMGFGRRFMGPMAVVCLFVSSVDAGPRGESKPRPSVRPHVPKIVANRISQSFLARQIADDTQVVEGKSVPMENFDEYADQLAEVLATFTPAQQRKIIYGQ